MSYIEQNVFLFNTTIRENITLGEEFPARTQAKPFGKPAQPILTIFQIGCIIKLTA